MWVFLAEDFIWMKIINITLKFPDPGKEEK